jgi:glyoxylase-like metal-dependent hydrolase (beta-lactamase superfamily II)
MINIKTFVFNPFMENTFLVYDESGEALIIDPGCYEEHEKKELTEFISKEELKVVKVINTHCHVDHCLGNKFVKDTYNAPLVLHKAEEEVLRSVVAYAPAYGFNNYEPAEVDEYITQGDKIHFGNSSLNVINVPGHSPGHIALVNKEEKICISGDVLFKESIGRTDLPGGHYDTLINSIQSELFQLPDETVVYTGHGPETTIGEEKQVNPFVRVSY